MHKLLHVNLPPRCFPPSSQAVTSPEARSAHNQEQVQAFLGQKCLRPFAFGTPVKEACSLRILKLGLAMMKVSATACWTDISDFSLMAYDGRPQTQAARAGISPATPVRFSATLFPLHPYN